MEYKPLHPSPNQYEMDWFGKKCAFFHERPLYVEATSVDSTTKELSWRWKDAVPWWFSSLLSGLVVLFLGAAAGLFAGVISPGRDTLFGISNPNYMAVVFLAASLLALFFARFFRTLTITVRYGPEAVEVRYTPRSWLLRRTVSIDVRRTNRLLVRNASAPRELYSKSLYVMYASCGGEDVELFRTIKDADLMRYVCREISLATGLGVSAESL